MSHRKQPDSPRAMHVAEIVTNKNGKRYRTVLVRHSYRELGDVDVHELYDAMDWLLKAQDWICAHIFLCMLAYCVARWRTASSGTCANACVR